MWEGIPESTKQKASQNYLSPIGIADGTQGREEQTLDETRYGSLLNDQLLSPLQTEDPTWYFQMVWKEYLWALYVDVVDVLAVEPLCEVHAMLSRGKGR